MPGEPLTSTKPYLSITQGKLNQKVEESTPGAIRRDYELKDGTKGTKFVHYFKNWTGRITDLRIKDGEYGQTLEVVFNDAVLTINTESRYFTDFCKKIMAVDINQPITVSPFDFESEGKRIVGVSVIQKGEKINSYYWDGEKSSNNFPEPPKEKMNKDDWKIYFINVKTFLIGEIAKKTEQINRNIVEEETKEPEIPVIDVDEEKIAVKDIPF